MSTGSLGNMGGGGGGADEQQSVHSLLEGGNMPSDRAMMYYERAKQLSMVSSGSSLELERQLREMYKALSFNAEESKFYLLMAKIYRQSLDLTSAMFCYRYVLRIEPHNLIARKSLIDLLILKGKELMMIGKELQWKYKFISARSCFDEALEFNRENNELWILKAVCHVWSDELTEAFESINKVIKPNRELPPEVYILRAKINWGRGLTEQGNQDIRIAAALDPKHPEVVGYINRSYAKSEAMYKKCLQAFKDNKLKEALEHINHAIFLTDEDVKLHLMKSKILRLSKDLQAAYDCVLKAKALFEASYDVDNFSAQLPSDINLQINLILNEMAINYAEEGNYEKAILLFNKIIRNEQQHGLAMSHIGKLNHKYYVNRGDCYRALQQLGDAIQDYEAALAIESTDWDIKTKLSLTLYLIATNYFNHSQYREVDVELSKAISYNPKVSEYYVLRGKARYYVTKYHEAYQDFKMALQLNPDNVEIQLRLQQFEDDNGGNESNSNNNNNNNNNNKSSKSGKKKPSSSTGTSSKKKPNGNTALQDNVAKMALEASMAQYKTERKVEDIKVEERDMIEMMLHPNKASKLPMLNLITTDCQKEEKDKLLRRKKRELRDRVLVSADEAILSSTAPQMLLDASPTLFLPEIVPKSMASRENTLQKSAFYTAHVLSREVKQRDHEVKMQFENRVKNEKGPMWRIVETASELARARSKASEDKMKALRNKK